MRSTLERFIANEKTQSILAFSIYFTFIAFFIDLPSLLKCICSIIGTFAFAIQIMVMPLLYSDENKEKIGKRIKQKLKILSKEIVMFLPIYAISFFIQRLLFVGKPENQIRIEDSFKVFPILMSIECIIIAPVVEEYFCRWLPYKFIKNKKLYIIISSMVFAMLHVINYSNAFYYIWFYILDSLYLGYRYYKTKDIWVTISIHGFNNLIESLIILLNL